MKTADPQLFTNQVSLFCLLILRFSCVELTKLCWAKLILRFQ